MRTLTKAAVLAVALSVPMAAFASQAATASKKSTTAAPKKDPAVASHTTAGVVKSSSDTSLVVTKGGKDHTFTVNASTKKEGTIETGAKVTVMYTTDGKEMTATSIHATAAKPASAKKPAGKK